MSKSKSHLIQIDNLLLRAEEYTSQILRTSVMLRESELMHQRRLKKDKDSKRKKKARIIGDDEFESPASPVGPIGGSSAVLNFVGQPKCISEGCVLQPHQMDSLKWLASLYENGINGILADDMGMGKTIQTIAIFAYVYETVRERSQPHLVVAPKSTISNWVKEFAIWAPFFRVVNLIPTMEHRTEILQKQMRPGMFDVCITTYEALLICESSLKKYKFNYAVFDEAHKLKNSESKIAQASRNLHAQRRLLLTGTPLQNEIGELWSLLNFLMPELFKSKEDFKEWFDFSKYESDKDTKMQMVKKLHKIMKPFLLRRTKNDLKTKLPDKIEINISVQLSQTQIDLYAQFLTQIGGYSSLISNMGSSKKSIPLKNYHNILMQLRKVCNHPYLFEGVEPEGADEFGEHIVEASGKLTLVDRILQKVLPQNDQLLLFSCFTQTLNIIEDFLIMRGVKYCRLDGSTNLDEREEYIQEFTKEGSEKQVFLISTRAGGLGINLESANHVILYDSDWNPQVDLQAMDRCHRIGQKKQVYVYRLISESTVEEKILERQAIKLKLDQVVIQQGHQAANKNLSKEEYEKILLHGAATIMQRKQEKINSAGEIDIDQLIKEGVKKHKELKEIAESQIDAMKSDNSFDFTIESIDMFRFQEKDFREEKKKVQAILLEQQAEEQKKAASMRQPRNKRQAAVQAMEQVHQFHDQAKVKSSSHAHNSEPGGLAAMPKKDKSITVQKVYEFQFYPNFERLQQLSLKIHKLQENYETISDDLKEQYTEQMSEGFHDWSQRDYVQFIKAFRRRAIDDVEGIASEIDTKTTEQVQHYLNVFLTRFRETKERDIVLKKFQQKDFDQKNLETILNFDKYKDFAILLQENHFFGRSEYINMMQKEHERLIEQNGISPDQLKSPAFESGKPFPNSNGKPLSLRLDHFVHSQPKKLVQEQLKYIATAIRAEKTLRDHMYHLNEHRKQMKAVMDKAKAFSHGYQEGIARKDQQMMHEDYQNQKAIDDQENKKKVSKVSDNNKFGKNRAHIARLFEK